MNYVAGGVVNHAARVMDLADGGQILFTKEAHDQIVDMVDDPDMVDRFTEYRGTRIKHGVEIEVYQYIGQNEPFINTAPPEDILLMTKTETALSKLTSLTSGSKFPFPNFDRVMDDPDSMLQIVENMGNALAAFQQEIEAKRFIESDQQTNVVIDSRI